MAAKVYSAVNVGLEAAVVDVEADIGRSLPNFLIVGLPDAAVQEARERVRAAIKNSGLKFPSTRVTVNLAPGDLKKEGPAYDLPVALAILVAAGELTPRTSLARTMFLGELALDGGLRPVSGVLAAALLARAAGFAALVVPVGNEAEGALVEGLDVYAAPSLGAVVSHCLGETALPLTPPSAALPAAPADDRYDFGFIQGQANAKRALEVAAAGGHNVRMSGPPGAGKTLLARALVTILPPLDRDEALEVTRIYSSAGLLPAGSSLLTVRPFRSPHHTTSHVALVGGGATPRPGEVSLAHRGVLFLDELPEFPRHVLEALRQPLEDGVVSVARASGTATFPAQFTLVAAENPCPCGYRTDPDRSCTCAPGALLRYQRRVSGPLLDRIDLHVEVPRLATADLTRAPAAEPSAVVRVRVVAARARQRERFRGTPLVTNAEMSSEQVRRWCPLDAAAAGLIRTATDRLRLSARSYYRVVKLARTVADLAGAEAIAAAHVAEALQYRPADVA
jgi:magnesium chelatase family protein